MTSAQGGYQYPHPLNKERDPYLGMSQGFKPVISSSRMNALSIVAIPRTSRLTAGEVNGIGNSNDTCQADVKSVGAWLEWRKHV